MHLSRVFRKTYHTTLGEYLNGLRVEFAFEQLKNPEADLSELALAAGFADQSHFTRVFKRITGNTPGALISKTGKGPALRGQIGRAHV